MKVYLSNSDYLGTIDRFLKRFDPTDPDRLTIETHKRWVSVHPVILTMVAALGYGLDPKKVTIEPTQAKSGHYLDRMGLYECLGQESPYDIKKREPAGRFIPLTQVRTPEEQTRFITDVIPILHLEPRQADAIKYAVGELVRNVIEHSRSASGAFVAVQFYPKTNMVRLGISDAGIGIRRAINQSWTAESDIDAITLALTPGITGTTQREGGTETNAGAGLFFIKSMAVVARQYFVLYSGSGLYKLGKRDRRLKGFPRLFADPRDDSHSESNSLPYFKGSVVAVDISLDQTQEFQELLAEIRRVYTRAVRERKKLKHKQPKFI